MLMMWKIQQAMEDDAIRTARIHPGNQDEVFICLLRDFLIPKL